MNVWIRNLCRLLEFKLKGGKKRKSLPHSLFKLFLRMSKCTVCSSWTPPLLSKVSAHTCFVFAIWLWLKKRTTNKNHMTFLLPSIRQSHKTRLKVQKNTAMVLHFVFLIRKTRTLLVEGLSCPCMDFTTASSAAFHIHKC